MDNLHLVYQPQYDAMTKNGIGCEAFMRLDSIELGTVSPGEFIPVAEEAGLINDLGEWALVEACRFNRRIIDAGNKPILVSVNISTSQLRGNRLLNLVKSIPEKTGMPLEYLEIEITEKVLMKNFEHNLEIMNHLKGLGVKSALDDFGIGYSSLNMLRKLPVNVLKLDRGFINEASCTERGFIVLNHVTQMSRDLKATVVCEGIETSEQVNMLKNAGGDIAQGFYYAKPMPLDEYNKFVYEHEGSYN